MSVDGATKVAGVAVRINNEIAFSGKIKANPKEKNSMIRTEEIFNQIVKIANEYSVDYIIFEDSYCGANAQAMKQLARLQGCIMAYCYLKDKGMYCFLPSEWRHKLWQNCGNKREEQKQMAIEYVNNNYGLHLSKNDDDEAEAICIGEAFCKFTGEE